MSRVAAARAYRPKLYAINNFGAVPNVLTPPEAPCPCEPTAVRSSSERWGRTHARGKKGEVLDAMHKLQAILNDLIHELQTRMADLLTRLSLMHRQAGSRLYVSGVLARDQARAPAPIPGMQMILFRLWVCE